MHLLRLCSSLLFAALRSAAWPCAALLSAGSMACVARGDAASPAVLQELAPTGTLRVGVATAPSRSALFAIQQAGQPSGVTVDLGNELGHKLGVPVEFVLAQNSGVLVDATRAGSVDVTFMPVDEERKTKLDFGPAYFVIESTYLVRPLSDIQNLAEVDRPNVRVVGITNTATLRAAAHSLKNTSIAPVPSVDAAMEMLRSGDADAFALTHDALPALALRLPGSRILDAAFLRANVAIAVPKQRPHALAYVTAFMQEAKASGSVRRAFDRAGLEGLVVASPTPEG
jgi:polar amino acid transport system substrate-binding protein